MRRLVLHIGSPKAGSTNLQDFLFLNREKLLGHGILFPVVEGENSQSHAALPKSVSGMAPGPNRGKLTFAKLEELIADSSAHTIVVSSEFFIQVHRYPEIADRVRDLVRRLDLDLTGRVSGSGASRLDSRRETSYRSAREQQEGR